MVTLITCLLLRNAVLFCVYLILNPSFHVNAEFGLQERKAGLWISEVNGIIC